MRKSKSCIEVIDLYQKVVDNKKTFNEKLGDVFVSGKGDLNIDIADLKKYLLEIRLNIKELKICINSTLSLEELDEINLVWKKYPGFLNDDIKKSTVDNNIFVNNIEESDIVSLSFSGDTIASKIDTDKDIELFFNSIIESGVLGLNFSVSDFIGLLISKKSSNRILNENFDLFADFIKNPKSKLKILNLRKTYIDSLLKIKNNFEKFIDAVCKSNLQVFNIADNSFWSFMVETRFVIYLKLISESNLSILDISNNLSENVLSNDSNFISLLGAISKTKIKRLIMRKCDIEKLGIGKFIELIKVINKSNIEEFDISDDSLSDDFKVGFSKIIEHEKIKCKMIY